VGGEGREDKSRGRSHAPLALGQFWRDQLRFDEFEAVEVKSLFMHPSGENVWLLITVPSKLN
jgi:hypothetical protein